MPEKPSNIYPNLATKKETFIFNFPKHKLFLIWHYLKIEFGANLQNKTQKFASAKSHMNDLTKILIW
jgi:hypothetical protein